MFPELMYVDKMMHHKIPSPLCHVFILQLYLYNYNKW